MLKAITRQIDSFFLVQIFFLGGVVNPFLGQPAAVKNTAEMHSVHHGTFNRGSCLADRQQAIVWRKEVGADNFCSNNFVRQFVWISLLEDYSSNEDYTSGKALNRFIVIKFPQKTIHDYISASYYLYHLKR